MSNEAENTERDLQQGILRAGGQASNGRGIEHQRGGAAAVVAAFDPGQPGKNLKLGEIGKTQRPLAEIELEFARIKRELAEIKIERGV